MLQCIAGDGYTFVGWSGADTSTNAHISVIMSGNRSLTANFDIVGRLRARLEVFYADTGDGSADWEKYQDLTKGLDISEGCWYKVTVKAVVPGEVHKETQGQIKVELPSELMMSASLGGTPLSADGVFTMKDGVAVFWVSANPAISSDVHGLSFEVHYVSGGTVDGSVQSGGRGLINVIKSSSAISYAELFGDGFGRPSSARIYFNSGMGGSGFLGSVPKPDAVSIRWPQGSGVVVEATGGRIVNDGGFILDVDLAGLTTAGTLGQPLPEGYTSIAVANGRGVVRARCSSRRRLCGLSLRWGGRLWG